jgi:hypothetical protein
LRVSAAESIFTKYLGIPFLDQTPVPAGLFLGMTGATQLGLIGHAPNARSAMQDVTLLFFTAVFFGLAFLYVKACQKLR